MTLQLRWWTTLFLFLSSSLLVVGIPFLVVNAQSWQVGKVA